MDDGRLIVTEAPAARLRAHTGLLAEMNDLKRVRRALEPASTMGRAFRQAWCALGGGGDVRTIALAFAGDLVAAARLAPIDAGILGRCGLGDAETREVLEAAFDAVAAPLDPELRVLLRAALGGSAAFVGVAPSFVTPLMEQPRAGATCPGKPRLVLEPPETHAEHCGAVAAYAVLLAPLYGALPEDGFLLGMSHHFHNAVLPDAGFTGEMLLGRHLDTIIERLSGRCVAELPAPLGHRIAALRPVLASAEHPAARAFHAADVIDRVLQQRHYARAAAFTIDQALEDLELVHAGPVQAFHVDVLREAGLP